MDWHILLEKWLHFYFTILINYAKVNGINCNIWPSYVHSTPCDLSRNISGAWRLYLGAFISSRPSPNATIALIGQLFSGLMKGQDIVKFYRAKDFAHLIYPM